MEKPDNWGAEIVKNLILPAVLTVLAFLLNSWADTRGDKEKVQDLDAKIISEEFADFPDNASKVIAMDKLLFSTDSVEHSKVEAIIERDYKVEFGNYLNKSDTQSLAVAMKVKQILDAINPSAVGRITDSLRKEQAKDSNILPGLTASKPLLAKLSEGKGFDFLRKKQYDSAMNYFYKADELSPGYHNSFEIATLLNQAKANPNEGLKNGKNNEALFATIKKKYLWKAPQNFRDFLDRPDTAISGKNDSPTKAKRK